MTIDELWCLYAKLISSCFGRQVSLLVIPNKPHHMHIIVWSLDLKKSFDNIIELEEYSDFADIIIIVKQLMEKTNEKI